MIIGTPKEIAADEKRVAMTPDSAFQLHKLGYECMIQSGAGANAGFLILHTAQPVSKLRKQPQNCGNLPI